MTSRLRAALGDAMRAATELDRLEAEKFALEVQGFPPATDAPTVERLATERVHLAAALGVVDEERPISMDAQALARAVVQAGTLSTDEGISYPGAVLIEKYISREAGKCDACHNAIAAKSEPRGDGLDEKWLAKWFASKKREHNVLMGLDPLPVIGAPTPPSHYFADFMGREIKRLVDGHIAALLASSQGQGDAHERIHHAEQRANIAEASEQAKLEEVNRAFAMLEAYGVSRERAHTIANGIDVLVTRMRRENDSPREALRWIIYSAKLGMSDAEYRKWAANHAEGALRGRTGDEVTEAQLGEYMDKLEAHPQPSGLREACEISQAQAAEWHTLLVQEETENKGLREALGDIAGQHIGEEIDCEDPDFEGAYEAIVKIARAALAQADREGSHE